MFSRIVSMKLLLLSFIIFVIFFDFLISTISPVAISIGLPSYNTYDFVSPLSSVILILTTDSSDKTILLFSIV